jgi:hypothetical protein
MPARAAMAAFGFAMSTRICRATPQLRVFRNGYNLLMLLPPSNSVFVPASELHISIFTIPSWS